MDKQLSILLVEDDLLDARLVRRALEGTRRQIRIECAESVREASSILEQRKFDIILSDLSLPDSFGLDTIARVRGLAPNTPMIVLTSIDNDDLSVKLLHAGAQDYIPKSMISGSLIDRAIRHAIQRYELLREINEGRDLLNAKNKRLEAMCKQAHEFVDNVSHEFRTPLTVIKEYASLICEGIVGEVSAEQSRMLRIIENRADDLNTMVDDMLDSSKLDAGLIGACRKACSIHEVIDHVKETLNRKATIKNVELTWNIATDLPVLYCDAEKIGRIITNLGVNALKFCGKPGEVCIQVYQVPGSMDVTFAIKDNGVGIASAQLQQIFERFRQLGTTARGSCKGFGLGLAIAKELVELNFGELSVSSEVDKGSEFFFTIPTNSPAELIKRYTRYIARSQKSPHMITLVSVHAESNLISNNQDELESFLNTISRCNDLLFPCHNGDFLIALPTDKHEMQAFVERCQLYRQVCNRNRPRGPLPDIHYEWIGTWHLDNESHFLEKVVEELTCKAEVTCV